MIDTHAHLDADVFDADRDEVIARAWAAGVEQIIIPSIEPSGFEKLQKLVQTDERLYRGIGIHPHNVASATQADLEKVVQGSGQTRVVAIGEIGIDYHYDFAPRELQKDFFRRQLQVAKRCGLPVIVHNREADDDILCILQEEQDGTLRGVLHCFSGSLQVLEAAMNLGFHVSFTGNISFKKSVLNDVVSAVPADRFMIETDSPYISPVPYRGQRNEPAHVGIVAQKVAEIRNITREEVMAMTSTTARKLFGLLLLLVILSIRIFAAEEEDEHPFPKRLGGGFVLTTNTIVEARDFHDGNDPVSYSYEGIFSFGGELNYELSDRFILGCTYLYSKNKRVIRDAVTNPFGQQYANTHQVVELGLKYLWNPYSRVVFYFNFGPCVFINAYDGGSSSKDELYSVGQSTPIYGSNTTIAGLCAGLGIFANIRTPIGIIAPGGEWRVDFFLASEDRKIFKTSTETTTANIATYFSLPRFSVNWYPNL